MVKVLLVVWVMGCGRVGFDAGGDAAATDMDAAAIDARLVDGAPASCRLDPRYVGGSGLASTYRVVSVDTSWPDARADCELDGAHLPVLDDVNEAASALVGDWIGITDSDVEGEWRTLDGALATFLPWAPGDPDGGTAENCGRLDNATQQFQDRVCAELRDYSCECE